MLRHTCVQIVWSAGEENYKITSEQEEQNSSLDKIDQEQREYIEFKIFFNLKTKTVNKFERKFKRGPDPSQIKKHFNKLIEQNMRPKKTLM